MKKNMVTNLWVALFMLMGVHVGGCSQQSAPADAQNTTGGSTTTAPAATAQASAAKSGVVIIGVEGRSVPLTFWDERTKQLAGYDADMAREAFKRAGLEYEFKGIVWADKEKDLENKQIDVVWSGLTITDERAKTYAFSSPYYKNRQAILVRADSPIQTKADLRGKKIGEHKGSPSGPFIKSMEPSQHEEFLELPDLFAAVLSGKIDAAVTDGVFIDYYALNTPGKLRVLDDNVPERGFAVGMRPSDGELLAKINKALAEMEADGTAKAIYKHWFSDEGR